MDLIKTLIFVALPSEAQPLIQHFSLKQIKEPHPFTIWAEGNIGLIITGVGLLSAATAVGYLYRHFVMGQNPYLINFGIAGHPTLDVGEAAIPGSIKDCLGDQTFYPVFLSSPPCKIAPLFTVHQKEETYSASALYDMEGSGFFQAASRLVSLEQIGLFKVVSDNLSFPAHRVTKAHVQECVSKSLSLFEQWIQSIPQKPLKSTCYCSEKWRLTETEKNQVQSLVRKIQVLDPTFSFQSIDYLEKKQLFAYLHERWKSALPK